MKRWKRRTVRVDGVSWPLVSEGGGSDWLSVQLVSSLVFAGGTDSEVPLVQSNIIAD